MKKFFLPFILLIAVLLRLPSLFEPYWYGDEGVYQVIGKAMAAGHPLYAGIWDNKPPLLYIIYMIFNGEQSPIRLFSLLIMIPTIVVFYFVARKLFASARIVYLAASLFALLFALPLLEGNIANAENFMLLPTLFAMLMILRRVGKNPLHDFIAGLLLGIAFLLKSVAMFDFAALLVFLFVVSLTGKKHPLSVQNVKNWFLDTFLLSLGFILPLLLSFVVYFFQGALSDYITAAFAQNVSYVGKGNTIFGIQALLFIKTFLLFLFSLAILIWRNAITKKYIFVYLWLAFSVYNAFFSGRPWIHYLLTLLPAFCLFIGIIFEQKSRRLLHVVLCVSLLFLFYKNFWIYGKTIGYYQNYVQFATGQKDEQAYRGFFDWFVNRDYAIADYIAAHSKEKDTIFIWGDNPQIYALSDRLPPGRYTVAYHVTFYPHGFLETKEAIDKEKPALMLVVRDDIPGEFLEQYELMHTIDNVKIYARRI